MQKEIYRREYKAIVHDNPSRKPQEIKLKIGGRDETTRGRFVPNINMSKWDDEAWLNINFPEKVTNEQERFDGKAISLKTLGREHRIYLDEKNQLEYEIEFEFEPESNVFEFDLAFAEGLSFHYQWPLEEEWIRESRGESRPVFGCYSLEEYLEGHQRPPEYEGSYAVYFNRSNHKYKTGKFCHIQRPKLIDADGKERWAEIWLDPNVKKFWIECDFEGLRFPVRLDPTIGYESVGAATFSAGGAFALWWEDQASAAGGTGSGTLSAYGQTHGADNFRGAVYGGDSSAQSTDASPYCTNESAITDASNEGTMPGSADWADASVTFNTGITDNYYYYLCLWWEASIYLKYDNGAAEGCYKSNTYGASLPTMTGLNDHDRRYSIHFDYPVATEPITSFEETFETTTGSGLDLNEDADTDHDWAITESGNSTISENQAVPSDSPDICGSYCLRAYASKDVDAYIEMDTYGGVSTCYLSYAFYTFGVNPINTNSIKIHRMMDADKDSYSEGELYIYRNSSGTNQLYHRASTSNEYLMNLEDDTWYYVEQKFESGSQITTSIYKWTEYLRTWEKIIDSETLSETNGDTVRYVRIGISNITSSNNGSTIYYDAVNWNTTGFPTLSETLSAVVELTRYRFYPDSTPAEGSWAADSGTTLEAIEHGNSHYIYTTTKNTAIRFSYSITGVDASASIVAVRIRYKALRTGSGDNRHLIAGLYIGGTQYYCNFDNSGEPMIDSNYIISLPDSEGDFISEWVVNPADKAAWEASDLNGIQVFFLTPDWDSTDPGLPGAQINELILEILAYGTAGDDAYMADAPRVGGVTSTKARIWTRTNTPAKVRVAYGTVEADVKNTTDPDSPETGVTVTSDPASDNAIAADGDCVTIDLTGLSAETTYYYNIFVNGRSMYEFESEDVSYSVMANLPKFTTFPTEDAFSAKSILAIGDMHDEPLDHQSCVSMAAKIDSKNIALLINHGDEHSQHTDVLNEQDYPSGVTVNDRNAALHGCRESYRTRRGAKGPNYPFWDNIERQLPVERIWSDHDYVGDNSTKTGQIPRYQKVDGGLTPWFYNTHAITNGTQIDLDVADSAYSDASTITITNQGETLNTRTYCNTDGFMVQIKNSSAGNDGWYTATVMRDKGDYSVLKLDQTLNADESSVTTGYSIGDPIGVVIEMYQFRTWNAAKAFKEFSPTYDYCLPEDLTGVADGGSASTLICNDTEYRQFTYTGLTGGTPSARYYSNGRWVSGDLVSWDSGACTGELVYHNTTDNIMVVKLDDETYDLSDAQTVTDGTWSCTVSGTPYTFPTESIYGVYPGMCVFHFTDADHTTDPSFAVVDSNDGNTLTFSSNLKLDSATFTSGDYFRVKREVLARSFWLGKCQFWIIDIRAKSDIEAIDGQGMPGADWLDGTREMVSPKLQGYASETLANKLVYGDSSGSFSDNDIVEGDVVVNLDVFRLTLYNAGSFSQGDVINWGESSSGAGGGTVLADKGTDDHTHDELYFRRTSGRDPEPGDLIDCAATGQTAEVWGDVRNEAAVVKINSSIDYSIDLETYWGSGVDKDLFVSGDEFAIYESGGSDHGSQLANEKAGHIQREWLVNGMNDSTAEWKFIIAETPVYGVATASGGNQYQLLPTIDPMDCLRRYLIDKIDYAHVFWMGADQHFAGLDDGQGSDPPFACMNVAPMYGRYATNMTHIPSITEWFVTSGGNRTYAGWGDDYCIIEFAGSGISAVRQTWNQGVFCLVELIDRQSITVSLYDWAGDLINNNELQGTFDIESTTTDTITVTLDDSSGGPGWTVDEWAGYMVELVASGKQYVITSNTSDTLTCGASQGASFGSETGQVKIYGRPWTGEEQLDYLGELTMTLNENTYGICSTGTVVEEDFEDSSGDIGGDWTEVID